MLFMLGCGKWYAGSTSDAHTHTHAEHNAIPNSRGHYTGNCKRRGAKTRGTARTTTKKPNDNFLLVRNKRGDHTQSTEAVGVCSGSVGSQSTTESDVRSCFAIHSPPCIDILSVLVYLPPPRNRSSAKPTGTERCMERRQGGPAQPTNESKTINKHATFARVFGGGEGATLPDVQLEIGWANERVCATVSCRSIVESSRVDGSKPKQTEGETLPCIRNPRTPRVAAGCGGH